MVEMLFDRFVRPWIASHLGPHCADPELVARVIKELDEDQDLRAYFPCGDVPLVPASATS